MKRILFALVTLFALAGCELDPNPSYYHAPTIENIVVTPEATTITANDQITVTANVVNYHGKGFACVKYWVFKSNLITDQTKTKFQNEVLYAWEEPTEEGKEGSWKKIVSMKHTDTVEIIGTAVHPFEAVIPNQKKGNTILFRVYCVSEYGMFTNSDEYTYIVQ